ncbi:phosphatase PAP2 family protein [Planotetraspora sp. A-T 1434]|uniref:phosphatase PAP2 family protein n=1 Tax=Planotetraspora sp. A-T 1434 TaxID=2979219 RepID=UPI0021BFEF13|nr:phosphatase PAP2 family protein [Planotetraspora sp. A-T 1434]MCT9933033.1 phosphatase PAP2 family protein [Planotetraspora sp. A-T 1434]
MTRVTLREVAAGRFSRLVARARSAALAGRMGGRPAPLVEAAGLLLVILLFSRLHAAVGRDVAAATANALALQSIERALHLDIALRANQWLTEHPALIQPAVYYYRLYYLAIIGVLVWVFVRHADVYIKVRRTLVAMAVLVLPVYWALPMSPPRFALPGVVDIIAEHDILGGHASREIQNGQNLSAMPSMHVGWSLWCAYAVWYALRASHPRLALLSWIFPLGMAAVVLITGNHYVLDIAGSAVLLVFSIAVVSAWGHLAERRPARD